MKPYSYKFQLSSQVLVSGTGAGQLSLTGGAPSGSAPLTTSTYSVFTSTNGLPNYYDVAIAVPFKLSDISNFASFTQMYDAYKISKVGLACEYLNNVSLANSTGLMPTMYTYWDQDDATIPPSLTSISAKQGVKRVQFGDRSRTSLRTSGQPKQTIALNTSVGLASAAISKPMWLDCVDFNVNHYALKIVITDVYLPGASAVTQAFRFNWTYNLAFRAPLLCA